MAPTMLLVTVGKAAVALAPLVTLRSPRWRAPWWAAGAVLALYGVLNAGGAWLVIAGVAGDRAGPDPAALWGHAALWAPPSPPGASPCSSASTPPARPPSPPPRAG